MTITGCKKEEKGTFTITGRVVQNCNDPIPLTGVKVELSYSGSSSKGNQVFTAGSATTDADGNFSITYENINQNIEGMYLRQISSKFSQGTICTKIPYNRDLNMDDIYVNAQIKMIYKLNLKGKQTSIEDTIYYFLHGQQAKIKVGPFYENQQLDTDTYYPIQRYGSLLSSNVFNWQLGKQNPYNASIIEFNLCDIEQIGFIDLSQAK
jgi:hypothetical protein